MAWWVFFFFSCPSNLLRLEYILGFFNYQSCRCYISKPRSVTWDLFWRYSGRGLFLDPPTVYIKSEMYNLSLPQSMPHDPQTSGDTCQWLVFNMSDLIPSGFLFNLFFDWQCRFFFTSWSLLQEQGQIICCWFIFVLYKSATIRIFSIKQFRVSCSTNYRTR